MTQINPINRNVEPLSNHPNTDPFDMDLRTFRSSVEGSSPVNEATVTTVTIVPVISVTKYVVTTLAWAC